MPRDGTAKARFLYSGKPILLIKETGIDSLGRKVEDWRMMTPEERDLMTAELDKQVASSLIRPTINWVPSKRPHAFYPHIMVPCWVMEEVPRAE